MDGRVYGYPKRHIDLIENRTGIAVNREVPYPNLSTDEALGYWLPYCDIYVYDHITYFNSWEHLFALIDMTDLSEISHKMTIFNQHERDAISVQWDELYTDLLPHRDRRTFMRENGIDIKYTKKWLEERHLELRTRMSGLQSSTNSCNNKVDMSKDGGEKSEEAKREKDSNSNSNGNGNGYNDNHVQNCSGVILPVTTEERVRSGAKVIKETGLSNKVPLQQHLQVKAQR